jgi:uncharacterized membrane protein
MSLLIALHVFAGATAIVAGAGAAWAEKGSLSHRRFGDLFAISLMLAVAISIYLATFMPPVSAGGAPPQASISVALLTGYFIASAWLTVRQKAFRVSYHNFMMCAVAAFITLGISIFGAVSAICSTGPKASAPYFVFAAVAAFAMALDVRVIRRGGLSGSQRIARHLWRMCAAWFFACTFFFLGQQKVMPIWLKGSPVLVVLGLTPLGVMAFWLLRIRATEIDGERRAQGLGPGRLRRLVFKRRAPCTS